MLGSMQSVRDELPGRLRSPVPRQGAPPRRLSIVSYNGTSTARSSSIGGAKRFDDWFICKGANPNVVVGAIVGEPDRRDRFRDQRDGGGDVAYPNMMDDETSFYMPGPRHRVAMNNSRSI